MGSLGISKYTFSLAYLFFPLLLLLLMLDCSEKKSQKDYLDLDEICQKYTDVQRRVYEKIIYECSGAILIIPGGDVEGFIKENTDRFNEFCNSRLSGLKRAIDRKSVSYDAKKAYQYLKKAEGFLSEKCENFSRKTTLSILYESINSIFGRDIFQGDLSEGKDCYIKNECKLGLYCGGKSCPGVCTPLGKQGDSCASNDECEGGFVCYSSVCTSTAATPCRSSSDCSSPQVCVNGVCTLFKGKGEPCESSEECDYSCDFQSKRCIQYRFVDYGKSCGSIDGDLVHCLKGYCVTKESSFLCEPYAKENEQCFSKRCDLGFLCSSEAICKKLSKEGEPCGFSCGYGLYCDNGVCKKKKKVGEVCISNQECKTDLCSEGKCFDKRQNVKACNEDSDCLSWNCLNNNCCSIQ